MPSCSRCQQDDKPCFYAKSRRGMRDKNAPRKRGSVKEQPRGRSTSDNGGHPSSSGSLVGNSSSESWPGLSSEAPSPASSSSRLSSTQPVVDPRRLIDLYYNFFHKAHPYIIPKNQLLSRWETDPESLRHLLPVVQYIGSLYAPDLSSLEFRAIALSQLELPDLPPTGFTVQTLLLLAIATHGEGERDNARTILDRNIYIALKIGMNHQAFAGMERDPILAESWRRTYWGMFIVDGIFAGIACASSFLLSGIETHVDLPCEDYDYERGCIPRPRTLFEYDSRDFEDEIPVFSSFTYLIDLTRIMGTILSVTNITGKELEGAVTNADAMLVSWKIHLPKEKQGVVDRNEDIDQLLFQAHNTLQTLLIYIHRPLSRLYHSPLEKLSRCAPPPPSTTSTGSEDLTHWIHTKKTIDAAQTAINLYALPSPILLHTPLGICGITKATLANLSACAYVFDPRGEKGGNAWNMTRDRIRLGLGATKTFAQVWGGAKGTERELKKIARGVFAGVGLGVERGRERGRGRGRGGDAAVGMGFGGMVGGWDDYGYGGGASFDAGFDSGDLQYLGDLSGLQVGLEAGIRLMSDAGDST
ncbi:Zn2Cys6 transcriptional regulator protein [Rutstroemia sp. NJR-2017a WRK4]|nr:Zn2Cys6 transcriptional regulator protein [Rutstroemia sp. NJR-2017a WRK4]